MSTKIMSGPICRMSLYGITIFGSQRRNPSHWFPPGTMILQMHPLHSSNSRSQTCPSFLQSLILITSLHFNSEKSILCSSRFLSIYYMIPLRFPFGKNWKIFLAGIVTDSPVNTVVIKNQQRFRKLGRSLWYREK